jgi:hypothetical protein
MHARRRRSGPLHQRQVDCAAPASALDCSGNPQLPQLGQHHDHARAAGCLAAFFDRLGCYEPAATVAGFAFSPLTAASVPELNAAITHLREVLGDQTYESLARKGETMTTAAALAYNYDHIDQARAELNAVSKATFETAWHLRLDFVDCPGRNVA